MRGSSQSRRCWTRRHCWTEWKSCPRKNTHGIDWIHWSYIDILPWNTWSMDDKSLSCFPFHRNSSLSGPLVNELYQHWTSDIKLRISQSRMSRFTTTCREVPKDRSWKPPWTHGRTKQRKFPSSSVARSSKRIKFGHTRRHSIIPKASLSFIGRTKNWSKKLWTTVSGSEPTGNDFPLGRKSKFFSKPLTSSQTNTDTMSTPSPCWVCVFRFLTINANQTHWWSFCVPHLDVIAYQHKSVSQSVSVSQQRNFSGQGKTVFQAEIDAAAELADFLRFNAYFCKELVKYQPISPDAKVTVNQYRQRGFEVWWSIIQLIWRWQVISRGPFLISRSAIVPDESCRLHWYHELCTFFIQGFFTAISPFNFSAIGGNLASAPTLMGNVVLWKPSDAAVLSNYIIYKVLICPSVPDGRFAYWRRSLEIRTFRGLISLVL